MRSVSIDSVLLLFFRRAANIILLMVLSLLRRLRKYGSFFVVYLVSVGRQIGCGKFGEGAFSCVYRNELSLDSPVTVTQLLRPSGAGCSSLVWSWGRVTYVCTLFCRMGCHSCRGFFFLELSLLPDGFGR